LVLSLLRGVGGRGKKMSKMGEVSKGQMKGFGQMVGEKPERAKTEEK